MAGRRTRSMRAVAALAGALLASAPVPSASAPWDYSDNGLDWGSAGLGLCAGGGDFSKQSPIDLPAEVTASDARKVFLKYPKLETAVHMYNSERSIAFTLPEAYRGGFGFVVNEKDLKSPAAAVYRLWQVSFHSPSEHTLAGRRMPLEMQMVHQRVTGGDELAVISVFFEDESSMPSPFLAALLEEGGVPNRPWEEVAVSFAAADEGSGGQGGLQALLRGSAFYAYEGSLTVPPCETGVRHFVRQEPVAASTAQLAKFSGVLKGMCPPGGNYRASPPSSTAGEDLVLIGSVDAIGGGTASSSEGAAWGEEAAQLPGVSGSSTAASQAVAENPDFERLLPGDSKALIRAKERYHRAMLELRAASAAEMAAKSAYEDLQALYDKTTGLVTRMHLMGQVQAANSAHQGTLTRVGVARQASELAKSDLVRVSAQEQANSGAGSSDSSAVSSANPDGIAHVQPTTLPPTELGSDDRVATTSLPQTFGVGQPPQAAGPLQYPEPQVGLPHGPAASPFAEAGAAQTEVAIGTRPGQAESSGLGAHGSAKLKPNLRQFDGPSGSVPIPQRRSASGAVGGPGAFVEVPVASGKTARPLHRHSPAAAGSGVGGENRAFLRASVALKARRALPSQAIAA